MVGFGETECPLTVIESLSQFEMFFLYKSFRCDTYLFMLVILPHLLFLKFQSYNYYLLLYFSWTIIDFFFSFHVASKILPILNDKMYF